MKLSELSTLNLKPVATKAEHLKPRLLQLSTRKKGAKALQEYTKYCNSLGFCPINPKKRWNSEKQITEIIAYGVYFGPNAKKIKTIEKETADRRKGTN